MPARLHCDVAVDDLVSWLRYGRGYVAAITVTTVWLLCIVSPLRFTLVQPVVDWDVTDYVAVTTLTNTAVTFPVPFVVVLIYLRYVCCRSPLLRCFDLRPDSHGPG